MAKRHLVFLLHGIKTGDGGVETFNELCTILQQSNIYTQLIDYGKIFLPGDNQRAVSALIEAIDLYQEDTEVEITVVGHSNGAWAAVQVAEAGYRIDNLVLISAALNRSHAFPECVRKVLVYYGESDWVLSLAHLKTSITKLFSNTEVSGWGDMGRVGYQGEDERVSNRLLPENTKHRWFDHPNIVAMIGASIAHM